MLMAVPKKGSQTDQPVVIPAAAIPAPVPGAVVAARPIVPRGGSPEELQLIAEHTAELSWGRDPFFRVVVPELPPDLELEAVLQPVEVVEPEPEPEPRVRPPLPAATGVGLGDNGTWAIIDRRVVQVGDILPGGFRVMRIERGAVTVELDNEEILLILGD